MNTKPLDTPASEFTEEELENMPPDELLKRSAHRLGSIEVLSSELAAIAATEIVTMMDESRQLVDLGMIDPELLGPVLGKGIILALLATIQTGRDIEQFAMANPDFPEKAEAKDEDVSVDESV